MNWMPLLRHSGSMLHRTACSGVSKGIGPSKVAIMNSARGRPSSSEAPFFDSIVHIEHGL